MRADWKLVAGIGVSALLCSGCGSGGSHRSASTCNDASPQTSATCIAAVVDPLVNKELQTQGLPGATIEIARNGKAVYIQAYGTANVATSSPVLPATEYQIGSVTKQFTAAAVLQLASAGKLGLDDTLAQYLPEYSFDPRLTLRMLLNQTSGLEDYLVGSPSDVTQGVTEQEVLTVIASTKLRFTPGSAYEYSNSNYYLLGCIIEIVSGQSYSEYLATHITGPAGLSHTSLTEPLTAARPYSYANPVVPGTKGLAPGFILDPSVYFASGALWSNVQDLAAWNYALFSGKLISQDQLKVMLTPPAGVPFFGAASVPSDYAMGWSLGKVLEHPFVWHNGQTLAYTAFNGVFPESGWSISILTNVDIQEDTPLAPFAQSIVEAVCRQASTGGNCF